MDWNPHYLFDPMMNGDTTAVDEFLKKIDFIPWNTNFDLGYPFSKGTEEKIAEFPEYADLIRAYDERYLETVRGCFQRTVEILRTLKDRGYPLYGLSNWSIEKFSKVQAQYPFFEWFDDMVISGVVGFVKPGKEIYDLLLQRAGQPAEKCLFIDDHRPNIDAALKYGWQAIQFQSAEQLIHELSNRGIL